MVQETYTAGSVVKHYSIASVKAYPHQRDQQTKERGSQFLAHQSVYAVVFEVTVILKLQVEMGGGTYVT